MQDIVEQAKGEVESGSVAYMEFALDYKKEERVIYCFYEGYEDRSFYSHRVKNYFQEYKYLDYVTIGKGNLIKITNLIGNHAEYNSAVIGYFVDKDYEEPISDAKVYTTSTYSIENLFVTSDSFASILRNEFGISHRHADFSIAQEIFEDLKLKFLNQTIVLNAWLSCQADKRVQLGLSTRLKIDKCIKSLLDKTVNANLTVIDYPIELTSKQNIENLFSDADEITLETLNAKVVEFQRGNLEKECRGKFLIKFLNSFLNKLQDEIGKNNSAIFKAKHTCRLRFEEVTCISQLTNNVNTPADLLNYFELIKNVA